MTYHMYLLTVVIIIAISIVLTAIWVRKIKKSHDALKDTLGQIVAMMPESRKKKAARVIERFKSIYEKPNKTDSEDVF